MTDDDEAEVCGTPELPEPALVELYAEALAVRARHGGHVRELAGRLRVDDGELVAYVNGVLDRRPEARCTQEREVAVWLNRMVVAEDRWHRTWGQVVSARAMARRRWEGDQPDPPEQPPPPDAG